MADKENNIAFQKNCPIDRKRKAQREKGISIARIIKGVSVVEIISSQPTWGY